MIKTAGSHMVITFDENETVERDSNENQVSEEKELSIEPRETDEKFFSFMNPIVNELVALLKKLNENAVIYFTMKSEAKALVFIEPASEKD